MTRVTESLRQQVRSRAGQRCEYCHMPEGYAQYGHHADHIVALKHGGPTAAENLAWACFQCNVNKGSDITSIDPQTGKVTRLFNPRREAWNDHFVMAGATITGTTPLGRTTVSLLKLNHPDQLILRRNLIDLDMW